MDNHSVDTAKNGREALESIAEYDYDIVITDIKMQAMGGRELYEQLLKQNPKLAAHTIFITGDTVSSDTLAFLASTPGPSLAKPVDAAELRRCVADLHEARRRGG